MSFVNGMYADDWIEENHPENGVFRIYWAEYGKGISLEDMGFGLRWEWYYKDGKRADGVSKGWTRDGRIKQTITWKSGIKNGICQEYYLDGSGARPERIFVNDIKQPRV